MCDSSDFEIDIDNPIPVEASEVGENEETQFNITPPPPCTIDISSDNENNNSQPEASNENDNSAMEYDDAHSSDESEDDGLVLPLPQRKTKESAPVWTVATKFLGGAKCNICGRTYTAPQGNTSNIMNHMKTKHSRVPSVISMIESESYRLCELCPQPPSKDSRYKIACAKHQKT